MFMFETSVLRCHDSSSHDNSPNDNQTKYSDDCLAMWGLVIESVCASVTRFGRISPCLANLAIY